MKTETIKNKADKIKKLSELTGMLSMIASANIKQKGYYTYNDSDTNEKIFVEA